MKTIYQKPIFNIFSNDKQKNKNLGQKGKIIIDYREKNSLVPANLKKLGFELEFRELKVADFIVKDTAIERKTISDFISSMINRRLVKQLEELQQYENKLLIIEGIDEKEIYGDEEFGNKTGVHPNAIRGFLLSILLKYKIPIIYAKNAEDTAKFMDVLSQKKKSEAPLNAVKKTLDKKSQMQFIIESFPGVGPKKSKELLEKFGTIQNIINAPVEELKRILGKKAETINEIIKREY